MFNWNLKNRNLCSCNCIRKCTFVHRRLWLKRTLSKTIKWTQIKFCQFSINFRIRFTNRFLEKKTFHNRLAHELLVIYPKMGLLSILKKLKEKEKEVRILMLWVFSSLHTCRLHSKCSLSSPYRKLWKIEENVFKEVNKSVGQWYQPVLHVPTVFRDRDINNHIYVIP